MATPMDLHVYTNNSLGVKDKISLMCETAVERGLRAVAFTDSIEMDRFELFECRRRLRHAYFDASKAKRLFQSELSVFAGIELRQARLNPGEVDKILGGQSYDLVLTSVTRDDGGNEFLITPETPPEAVPGILETYISLLLATVRTTDFDALSGVLKPLRYYRGSLSLLGERLEPLLKEVAAREKAFELTTKDLRGSDALRDLSFSLLRRFRELGGKYVIVGSGCRFHDEIGEGVDQAVLALRRAGFSTQTFYDQRVPYQIDL